MRVPEPRALAATRDSWHRVAEHVLAAGQFARAGTIRLRPVPGGFATVVPVDGRTLAVVGDRLVVGEGDDPRSVRLDTLRSAASFAGVEPGLHGSYPPATSADPDAPLTVDGGVARALADWFAFGDVVLRRFADAAGRPQEPVLWPEHFDLGISLEAVNYGCSLGDAAVATPYLYVSPHEGPPGGQAGGRGFWNTSFGAVVRADRVTGVDDAVAFLQRGRALSRGIDG